MFFRVLPGNEISQTTLAIAPTDQTTKDQLCATRCYGNYGVLVLGR
ncbi:MULTISPECIES: hypothetical protein [unclassified Nostoc]|nr:hypothetical protein [Nostoc sp. 'Peltigera membranacea cyanobiont' 210A]